MLLLFTSPVARHIIRRGLSEWVYHATTAVLVCYQHPTLRIETQFDFHASHANISTRTWYQK
jgi:hypothetical protein